MLRVLQANVFIIYKFGTLPSGMYVTGSFARSSPYTHLRYLWIHLKSCTLRKRVKPGQTKGLNIAVFQPSLFCFLLRNEHSFFNAVT